MSDAIYKCELCGRDNFKSQRGLSKQKLENKGCRDHLKARFGSNTDAKIAAACLPVDTVHKPQNCAAGSQNAKHYPDMNDGLGAKTAKYMSLPDKDFISVWLIKAQSQLEQSQAAMDSDANFGMYDAENDVIFPPTEASSARQKLMLDNFKDYAKRANDFVPSDANKFVTAITLLQTLRRTKASLDTYEAIMRWKLESQGLLRPGESLAKPPHFMSREQVYRKLKERYNRQHGFGIKTEIVLPGSKSRATLITSELYMVIQQLLIDPRVRPHQHRQQIAKNQIIARHASQHSARSPTTSVTCSRHLITITISRSVISHNSFQCNANCHFISCRKFKPRVARTIPNG